MLSTTRTLKLLPLLLLAWGNYTLCAQTTPAPEKPSRISSSKNAETLPEFPKLDPEKFLAELKVLQPDGSPYRAAKEDWDGAKQRVATDPAWKTWLTKRRFIVDSWMQRHQDRPGWKAGWHHDFVSPKDGSFLIWTEEIPSEQTKTFTDKNGQPVEITPKLYDAWVYRFRQRHISLMTEAAQLYRLTGESRYAEWAAGQLDFYANNLNQWPEIKGKGGQARLGCQSLDDATMLTQLTATARLLFDWAPPERRQLWFDKLFKPEVELLDHSFQIIHNIATWQRCAQAGVALLYNDEDIWKRVVDGPYGLRAQIQKGVTSDYFWYEQSMGYNSFVVKATEPLFTLAGLLGKQDRLHTEAAIIENLMLAPLTIRFPDNSLPNPADQTGLSQVPFGLLQETARIWPTTIGLKRAAQAQTWLELLDPQTAPDNASDKLPEVVSRHFESTRYALLRQGPWQIFLHYGQLGRSHSQAEALNWSASYNGIDITHDAGTVGYGSPLSMGYYRQGLAQNVPLLNGDGQEPWKLGRLTEFDATAAIMAAEQPQYRANASANRRIKINGDTFIDEATIRSVGDNDTTSTPGLALHLQGKPKLATEFQPVTNFAEGRPEPFKYWKDVRSATFKDCAEVIVEFAKGLVLRVEFTVPGEFTLYVGSSPDQPPARRTGFYLETHGREATFITKLSPVSASH